MTPQERIWLAEDEKIMRYERLTHKVTEAGFWFFAGCLFTLWLGGAL